jgi:hypothetical protein
MLNGYFDGEATNKKYSLLEADLFQWKEQIADADRSKTVSRVRLPASCQELRSIQDTAAPDTLVALQFRGTLCISEAQIRSGRLGNGDSGLTYVLRSHTDVMNPSKFMSLPPRAALECQSMKTEWPGPILGIIAQKCVY